MPLGSPPPPPPPPPPFVCLFAVVCPIISTSSDRGAAPGHTARPAASLPPAIPRPYSASAPAASRGPQEIGLIVCGLPRLKETLHCCRVTAVVFNSAACSDLTHAGRHHLLYPLPTTMPLAKSRSQTLSVPSRDWTECHYIPASTSHSSYADSLALQAAIRTARGKELEGGQTNTETDVTTRAWYERLQTDMGQLGFMLWWLIKMVAGDDLEVHSAGLRLLDRAAAAGPLTHSVIFIPVSWTCRPGYLQCCLSNYRATRTAIDASTEWLKWMTLSSAVRVVPAFPCTQSQLWVAAGQGRLKNPTWRMGFQAGGGGGGGD